MKNPTPTMSQNILIAIIALGIIIISHVYKQKVAELAWKAGMSSAATLMRADLPIAQRIKLDDQLAAACFPFGRDGFHYWRCRRFLRDHEDELSPTYQGMVGR